MTRRLAIAAPLAILTTAATAQTAPPAAGSLRIFEEEGFTSPSVSAHSTETVW